jgi:hypothetical protein
MSSAAPCGAERALRLAGGLDDRSIGPGLGPQITSSRAGRSVRPLDSLDQMMCPTCHPKKAAFQASITSGQPRNVKKRRPACALLVKCSSGWLVTAVAHVGQSTSHRDTRDEVSEPTETAIIWSTLSSHRTLISTREFAGEVQQLFRTTLKGNRAFDDLLDFSLRAEARPNHARPLRPRARSVARFLMAQVYTTLGASICHPGRGATVSLY